MRKEVYEINKYGFIIEIYVTEFDELGNMFAVKVPVLDVDGILVKDEDGNIVERVVENLVTTTPRDGFHRPKWTGTEWVEDMPQEEIDELSKPIVTPPTDTEILGQQMTEREIESMLQGQQITDIDLRLFEMEVTKNV